MKICKHVVAKVNFGSEGKCFHNVDVSTENFKRIASFWAEHANLSFTWPQGSKGRHSHKVDVSTEDQNTVRDQLSDIMRQ